MLFRHQASWEFLERCELRVAGFGGLCIFVFTVFSLSGCGGRNISTEKLHNGVQSVVISMPQAPMVTLQAWFRVGSRHEQKGWEGASHFLEHLLFRRDKDANGQTLVERVESIGGLFNAATSHDYTYFYITLAPEHFRKGLAVLREALREPAFTPDAFEKEKRVVLAEMDERESDPWSRVYKKLWRNIFAGHPYQREVIGSRKSVEGLTHLQIGEYYAENYRPDRLSIVVAGPLEKKEMAIGVRESFGDFTERSLMVVRSPDSPRLPEKEKQERITGDVSLEYFAEGFQIPDAHHADIPALDVLATILGEGKSSRLHQELVEKEHVVQDIGATIHAQKEAGLLIVYGVCNPAEHERLSVKLSEMINKLKAEPPTPTELERARTVLETDYLRSRETAANYAQEAGTWSALSDVSDMTHYLNRVREVTPKQIQKAAADYLKFPQTVFLVPE